MREALLVLYLKSDSSKFHHLLGFTNVPAVNEDEYTTNADEVLGDQENHKENRQFDTQDNLLNTILRNESINKTKIEESTKKDTVLVFRENEMKRDSLH